jgi:hypothetical protein
MDVRGLLARVVQLILSVVVLIIVAGIHSWARWLAGPFDGMFSFRSANDAIAVNWGIAAVVYLIVGGLIARLFGATHRDRPLRRSSYSDQEIA